MWRGGEQKVAHQAMDDVNTREGVRGGGSEATKWRNVNAELSSNASTSEGTGEVGGDNKDGMRCVCLAAPTLAAGALDKEEDVVGEEVLAGGGN